MLNVSRVISMLLGSASPSPAQYRTALSFRRMVLLLLIEILAPGLLMAATPPCLGGRYLIPDGQLVTGSTSPEIDAIDVRSDRISIDSGCPAHEVTKLRVRGTKTARTVVARCKQCGARRNVRLVATIRTADHCARITGVIRARNTPRKSFAGQLSRCGDEIFDSGSPTEECEAGACPDGQACLPDCMCPPPLPGTSTTTTHPVTTTTTIDTTTPCAGCPADSECPPDHARGCDGICYPQTWLGDGQCDEIAFNCSAFGNDEGDCQALPCPLDMVEACDGTCYPSNQLANGHCDQPFNCSELASDAGDCSSQPLAHDFSVFDTDGPGIGKFRDCTPTKDCTPTRDCTPTDDCTPTRSCNITGKKDTRDCSRCLLSVFGHCVQPGNDPVCEAAKALQNVKYQAECAAKKLDCERLKTTEKLACEANKAAKKADCERIKAQDKLICVADKTAQKLDCERLKEVQKVGGEVVEAAIHYSQERALMEHPRPIPDAIRHALYPYFSAELLDSVVWTDDHGDIFSLQKFITEINERAAVTLGTVIVFKHPARPPRTSASGRTSSSTSSSTGCSGSTGSRSTTRSSTGSSSPLRPSNRAMCVRTLARGQCAFRGKVQRLDASNVSRRGGSPW
jgi:hypothetical protein